MAAIPLSHGLLLAAILFSLGLIGVLMRRNLIFILMSIEIMLNAAGLAFVAAGSHWGMDTPALPGYTFLSCVPLPGKKGPRRLSSWRSC